MKKRIQLFILGILIAVSAIGQNYPQDYFRLPINQKVSLSGVFAEIRPNHFHGGIDLRIGGKIGEPVYAAAEGYVSRIAISPWGGGKMLYITHPNGYKTVYMHLNNYCGEIARYVSDYQTAHQTYQMDINIPADALPVQKGQLVGNAGNTGGSGGPHLHFEIRYAENDQPINPLYFGFPFTDPVNPTIVNVKLYPANDQTLINGKNSSVALVQSQNGKKGGKTVKLDTLSAGGKFYAGIYAYDLSEQGSGKNGVERVELWVDGELFYRYTVPTFLYEETRSVHAIIDYPEYQRSGAYYILTRMLPGNRNPFSKALKDDGYLCFEPGSKHRLEYKVMDLKGNTTSKIFYVKGVEPQGKGEQHVSNVEVNAEPITYYKRKLFMRNGLCADFDAYTVYENDYLIYRESAPQKTITPVYYLTLRNNPLPPRQTFTVSVLIPEGFEGYRDKMVIVNVSGKKLSACSSKFNGEYLDGFTKNFGGFGIALDTVSPVVRPKNFNPGQKLVNGEIRIGISDNLSGISSYHCFIDEEWVLAEYDGKTASLIINAKGLRSGSHKLKAVVKDAVGNETEMNWIISK